MPRKVALNVGINAYPDQPLQGCVNDAHNWNGLLRELGYVAATLIDADATRLAILEELRGIVRTLKWGDRLVFTYSGHGSWVPDLNGDEPDGRDEVLVPHDYASGNGFNVISDDDMADLFAARRRGVRVTVISDSCHSGSVNRVMERPLDTPLLGKPGGLRTFYNSTIRRARFMPPAVFLEGAALGRAVKVEQRDPALAPRNHAGTVLLSGCADEEYSYDAFIEGVPQGAFSWAAITSHKAMTGDTLPSMRVWHKQIRALVPSADYPQSPQMYASLWQRGWRL